MNKTIFITGASGFVGSNIISNLTEYIFRKYDRTENIEIMEDIVLHFAGKAHDLKQISNSNEYYEVNTELTKKIFDAFLISKAKVFITISSVKAIADELTEELTEDHIPNPITHYGKSKLFAEQYILSKVIPFDKRVYILRPCMIYGPGNKGNLNLLYKVINKGYPWPLTNFDNKRSFCSIENFCFIIKELIENDCISSDVFNISDDEPLSTNEIIRLIADSMGKTPKYWTIPKFLIKIIANFGDIFYLPINTERLNKLTSSYIVSNHKILKAINKPLPINSRTSLIKTFSSFSK